MGLCRIRLRTSLTLPVMFVVTGAGQSDHHCTVKGQDHGTEAPAASTATLSETMQLPRQVEGGEAQARESNYIRGKSGNKAKTSEDKGLTEKSSGKSMEKNSQQDKPFPFLFKPSLLLVSFL